MSIIAEEIGDAGLPLAGEPEQHRDDRYLRLLLMLLVSAAFFEGYDGSILALLLPNIGSSFSVGEATLGVMRIPIELGLFAAFFVARLSDRLGRRPVLLWSVVGYTVFTALTALSWNIWSFAFFQFASRVFLGAEYAIGVTMIVEEYPAERRARALGTLLTFAALGTIAVGILLFLGLDQTSLDWRAFYLVGLLPLLVLGVYRRRIKETKRFEEVKAGRVADQPRESMLVPWRAQHRRNLVLVGLIHMFRSIPLFGATAWWAYFAERERGFTSARVSVYITCAYGLGCLGYYVCGRLMERIGRRPTGLIYGIGGIAFSILLFQTTSMAVGFVALIFAVGFGLGSAPAMSAVATELFPTEIRGQTAAWIRNIFEIMGYVLGPAVVGILGDHHTGAIGNVGDTCTVLMLLQVPTLYLIWRFLPETKGRALEDVAA